MFAYLAAAASEIARYQDRHRLGLISINAISHI
jgi:hypothetical protein